eukprot:11043117-Lingulodinium_polyedra.AAC.1
MPLLPKPQGGHRGIGHFTGLHRLWTNARRRQASAWERANARPYFAAAAGKRPMDEVQRQCLHQEDGHAQGLLR